MLELFTNPLQKFLVDNAPSMMAWWAEATEALSVLIKKVAGQDKDGVDLSFTCGRVKLKNQKGSSRIGSAMDEAQPSGSMGTHMGKALGDILAEYLNELQGTKPQKRKCLTVIVLTDGIWAGMTDKTDVGKKVVHFLEQLGKLTGHLKDRLASIEFIQFGNDKDTTHRLRHLDEDLKHPGVP